MLVLVVLALSLALPEDSDALALDVAGAGLAAAPLLPLRKSVTYQPVPLSWKPAAVSCFLNALLPQVGHSDSGASETFCKTSLENPQDSQR